MSMLGFGLYAVRLDSKLPISSSRIAKKHYHRDKSRIHAGSRIAQGLEGRKRGDKGTDGLVGQLATGCSGWVALPLHMVHRRKGYGSCLSFLRNLPLPDVVVTKIMMVVRTVVAVEFEFTRQIGKFSTPLVPDRVSSHSPPRVSTPPPPLLERENSSTWRLGCHVSSRRRLGGTDHLPASSEPCSNDGQYRGQPRGIVNVINLVN
jgi:hypothetical protein